MKKIFFFILAVAFISINSATAQNWWKEKIRGEGPKVTKDLDLPAFEAVRLSLSADLYIRQGPTQSVRIEAQQNIIDNIIQEVEGSTWRIRPDRMVTRHEGIKIYITVPRLTEASVSGSGDIIGETTFSGADRFYSGVSGSGHIKLDLEAKEIEVKVSGSGNVNLKGSTESLLIRISGSGHVNADDLTAQKCNVQVSGSGRSSVNVSEDLEVKISGSGDVAYKGRPRLRSNISGSGDLINKD